MLNKIAWTLLLALSLTSGLRAQDDSLNGISLTDGVVVDAPGNLMPGDLVAIDWVGPDSRGDYIAIAPPNSAVTTFADYARTKAGTPALMTAPAEPGFYEIRYVSPITNEILATDSMFVGPIEIDLTAPDNVEYGSSFSVTWDGPILSGDALVLTAIDGSESPGLSSIAADDARQVSFTAPTIAGPYEIQYKNADGETLQSAAVEVFYTASLEAAAETVAGADILVNWTGPNASGDFVIVVPLQAAADEFGSFGLTKNGSPLKIMTSDMPGEYEIRYVTGEDQTIIARQPLQLAQPVVSIETVSEAISGSEILVTWDGPNNQNDYLTVVPRNTREGISDNYSFVRQGSPITLQLPNETGRFEILYVTGQSGFTLASNEITLVPEPTVLVAQGSIIAGSALKVAWRGPEKPDDMITLVPASAEDEFVGVFAHTRDGSELLLKTEEVIGAYELRYISGETGKILSQLPISLKAPPTTLQTPESVVAGATISIEWSGPDNDEDFITIVPAGSDDSADGNYTYTRNGAPLDLITKDVAGEYEIRYISGESRSVLARAAISLIVPESSLQSVPEAVAGSEVLVSWTGPDNQNDFVTVVPTGAISGEYGNYSYTRRGPDLPLLTTDVAGEYELRYVSGQSYTTLSSVAIRLTAPAISIDALPVAVAATFLEVVWSGPSNKNDFLTVVPVASEAGALGAYQYTRKGNPLVLMLPVEGGQFEIRYVSGQSMRTLESLPLTILAQ